ncbi:MAG TPA: hypothetical protein VN663_07800, partial [Ramlibacter sp.]|nr:hypothetical protein [Ramlibacter sp.]
MLAVRAFPLAAPQFKAFLFFPCVHVVNKAIWISTCGGLGEPKAERCGTSPANWCLPASDHPVRVVGNSSVRDNLLPLY